jgi:ferredoxin-NADP reductase
VFESLGRIKNPFVRSVTAAATAFSLVTLVAAVGITATKTTDKLAYKLGIYASLMGTGCAAIFGLVCRDVSNRQSTQPTPSSKSWTDWRNFVVVRKVKESEEITSFYLQPEDKGEIPNFQPGQFLTIKLYIPGQTKPIIRTYSLSDYSQPCDYYRLSIKREPTPKGLDVPPGVASNFMHDRIQESHVIQAKPPNGKFVLDVHQSIPAVLISNGVGITPMFSMAKACTHLNPNRPIWFVHGSRDGQFHAFRDEVMAMQENNPNLQIHFRYSRPRPEDEGYYHSVGYVDTALIKQLVGQEAEFFLCGSPPFMQSLREGLAEWGVPESRVFFESFSKRSTSTSPASAKTATDGVTEAEIVFAKSGKTLTWREGDSTILEFAEANNINPPYSCRVGVCGTCTCQIREGEVAYQESPTATPDEGSVLICISKPKTSRVVLDI